MDFNILWEYSLIQTWSMWIGVNWTTCSESCSYQFPSLHRQSVLILTNIVNEITQIPTVVKVELDLHSIEVGVLRVFRLTMLRLCDALEYKNLLLRCRFGCYRYCLGLSRFWYDIDKPGLLRLLQECMSWYNIDILLRYQDQSLNPDDVFSRLGRRKIDFWWWRWSRTIQGNTNHRLYDPSNSD